MNTSIIAFGALLVNAALCAAFATVPDTFITSTALLAAVLILTIRKDEDNGEHDEIHARGNDRGRRGPGGRES